jgi:hypothetical protein
MRLIVLAAGLLALTPPSASAGNLVVLDGGRWAALLPPPEPAEAPLPGPYGTDRIITLTATADRVDLVAEFSFDTFEPGWLQARLFDQSFDEIVVLQDGGPAAWDLRDGAVVATAYIDGPTTFTVRATVHRSLEHSPLELRALGRTARAKLLVTVPEGLVPVVTGAVAVPLGDGAWAAHGLVTVGARLRTASSANRLDLLGGTAVGLTIGDSVLDGRARLRWSVLEGSVDRVSFRARNVGADLAISGPGVGEVTRTGELVTVALNAPTKGLVEFDLTWTMPLPEGAEGRLPIPTFVLDGTRRTTAALQLARDGGWEALPDLDGWTGRSASALPPWARGLVTGTPTAAFTAPRSDRGGTLQLLRYEPVSGPAVLIDVADYLGATSADGRVLMRARYEILNDRATDLRLVLPPDVRLLSVRIHGEAARFTSEPLPAGPRGGQQLRIPLPRSVETVEGMISFPIEIAWLSDGEPWDRRTQRSVRLPRLDAPIATARVTLHLPPGYREVHTRRGVDRHRVDGFTEGDSISYGFKVTDEGDRDRAEEADRLFQSAVTSWMDNEFDDAQAALDELSTLGAGNDNTVRLQSNLTVVTGNRGRGEAEKEDLDGDGPSDDADKAPKGGESMKRRIIGQARARADEDYRNYAISTRSAQEKEQAGDYAGAEEDYKIALELGEKLAGLDQEESSETSSRNMFIAESLEKVGKKKMKKTAREREFQGAGAAAAGISAQGQTTAALPRKAPPRGPSGSRSSAPVPAPSTTEGGAHVVILEPAFDPAPEPAADYEFEFAQIDGQLAHAKDTIDASRAQLQLLPESVLSGMNTDLPGLTFSAANRSVLVPRLGQVVQFQQLLLPADGTHEVLVRARLIP